MQTDAFVFVVCGDRDATRLNIALKFLRHFSLCGIVVVRCRTGIQFDCNRVIDAPVPDNFNNEQAVRLLKSSLHRILPWDHVRYCYLDNDVIAVRGSVDEIFSHAHSPVSFAPDHSTLDQFSQCAVNCGCKNWGCDHLREAIFQEFQVQILEQNWRHWNGGVFVFNRESFEFMDYWHEGLLTIFGNPYWKTRDQGVLAAAAWKYGLQCQPNLPERYNFIVDALKDDPDSMPEAGAAPFASPVNKRYSLSEDSGNPAPSFLHFINNGAGKRGWKNWDDVERLLQ